MTSSVSITTTTLSASHPLAASELASDLVTFTVR